MQELESCLAMATQIQSSSFRWNQIAYSTFLIVLRMALMRDLDSIIPGPNTGVNKSERLKHIESVDEYTDSEDGSLFSRVYEWRLKMNTGDVKERFLTGTEFSMDFPMIHRDFTGVKNKYGYTQVTDSNAISDSGMPKYGGQQNCILKSQPIIKSIRWNTIKSNRILSALEQPLFPNKEVMKKMMDGLSLFSTMKIQACLKLI
ncbi:hypothetical protein OIU84_000329 [Salix udensis]|uniref:Uncharacterized protein n=1 Tax=Salix udensis TaxID=889485 RepID=A0AAD6PM99_9ROSI|nr:hypothetical protein OIU84_000329 [Salix udensis]